MAETLAGTGGSFHGVLRRVGLADASGLLARRAVPALVGLCWLPLLVLTIANGTAWGRSTSAPFLYDLSIHGRLLITLPLLLVAEKLAIHLLAEARRYADQTDLVPAADRGANERARAQLDRRLDSRVAELVLLAIAFVLPWLGIGYIQDAMVEAGVTGWLFQGDGAGMRLTPAGWWYLLVAVPLAQFIVLRWIWRFVVWAAFLWSYARLDLQLNATHPDRTGGLAPLIVVQAAFTPLFLAGSVLVSSYMANDILYTDATLRALSPQILAYVVGSMLVLLLPLIVFLPVLRHTKIEGLLFYGALGDSITDAFAERWRTRDHATLIDATDPSSVTDYTAMYQTVASMRLFPFSARDAIGIVVTLLIPFAPLLLSAMSFKEILSRLVGIVV